MKRSHTVGRRAFLGALGGGLVAGCSSAVVPITLPPRKLALSVRAARSSAFAEAVMAAAPAAASPASPSAAPAPRATTFIADIHCHTFNARDLPMDGFIRSLAQGMGVPAAMDPLLGAITRRFHCALVKATPPDGFLNQSQDEACAQEGGGKVEDVLVELVNMLKILPLDEGSGRLAAFARTLQNVARSREDIASSIAQAYPDVELFTPSLIDFGYFINKDKKSVVLDAYVHPVKQVELHAEVSAKSILGQLPNCNAVFHPYVAFNPWRQVAELYTVDSNNKKVPNLDHIKRAVGDLGFVGVKLYPPSGFLPLGNAHLHEFNGGSLGEELDDALRALYTWCVAEDVPIMTHASTGNSFFKDSSWRASPWGWRRVLDEFPKLRVCFGHFGHLEGIDGISDPLLCLAWAEGFVELMLKYDNVYADISNTEAGAADDKKRQDYQGRFLFWLCGRLSGEAGSKIATRLLYGSDWWMGMLTGMDTEFFQRVKDMVEVQMAPLKGRPAAARFAQNLWGENAPRFLGIWGNDGKARSDGTARRLRRRYDALGKKEHPRWL